MAYIMQLIEKESAKQKRQSGPLKPKDFSNQQFTYMLKKIVETKKTLVKNAIEEDILKINRVFISKKST